MNVFTYDYMSHKKKLIEKIGFQGLYILVQCQRRSRASLMNQNENKDWRGIICISGNRTVSWKNSCAFLFRRLKTRFHKSKGGESRNLLIAIVTDGWASIHNTFQSVPLDCFPEQNENLYNQAEYILPAQVHKLNSHSAPQSNSV